MSLLWRGADAFRSSSAPNRMVMKEWNPFELAMLGQVNLPSARWYNLPASRTSVCISTPPEISVTDFGNETWLRIVSLPIKTSFSFTILQYSTTRECYKIETQTRTRILRHFHCVAENRILHT
jgi:hypothetical protein